MLICYLCGQAIRSYKSQRSGAHSRCLQLRPHDKGHRRQLRLMALPERTASRPTRWPRIHWTASGADPVGYLLTLANQGRRHKRSIVGRCWIDASLAPATRPVIVSQTKKWSGA